jgi:hypothetical protein
VCAIEVVEFSRLNGENEEGEEKFQLEENSSSILEDLRDSTSSSG